MERALRPFHFPHSTSGSWLLLRCPRGLLRRVRRRHGGVDIWHGRTCRQKGVRSRAGAQLVSRRRGRGGERRGHVALPRTVSARTGGLDEIPGCKRSPGKDRGAGDGLVALDVEGDRTPRGDFVRRYLNVGLKVRRSGKHSTVSGARLGHSVPKQPCTAMASGTPANTTSAPLRCGPFHRVRACTRAGWSVGAHQSGHSIGAR